MDLSFMTMLCDTTAYESGRFMGIIVRILLLTAGVIKCIQISRRPTTCAKCTIALALVLGGLLVSGLYEITSVIRPPGPAYVLLICFAAVIILLGGLILAIVGLADYSNHPDFVQGRKQAIWAIILSGLFLLLVMFGAVSGWQKAMNKMSGNVPAAGTVMKFDALNYSYRMPGPPWANLNATNLNPEASFAMLRTKPYEMVIIIAEKLGLEVDLSVPKLLEINKANLSSMATDVSILEEVPVHYKQKSSFSYGQLEGYKVFAHASLAGKQKSQISWLFSTNGFCYQIFLSCAREDEAAMLKDADMVLNGFSIIDQARVAHSPVSKPFGRKVSAEYGYSLNLEGTSWGVENYSDTPEADASASDQQNTGMIIAPFILDGLRPPTDLLADALLGDYNQRENEQRKTITNGIPSRITEFSFTQKLNEKHYVYKGRILCGKNAALLVILWSQRSPGVLETAARQVFNALEFTGGTRTNCTGLKPEMLKWQAKVTNRIGVHYHNAQNYWDAIPYFSKSHKLVPKDGTYLGNVLNTMFWTGCHKEAMALVDAALPEARNVPFALGWQARHLDALDHTNEAGQVYEKLMANDGWDQEDVENAARHYGKCNDWKAFEALFEKAIAHKDSISLRRLRARICGEFGRHQEAAEFLKADQKAIPFNPELAYGLIDTYFDLKQFNDALNLADTLITNGFVSADAYYNKGCAEYRLGWHRKAKESLLKGHALNPNNSQISDLIKRVSAELGEGDNSTVLDSIPAVPLPASLQNVVLPNPAQAITNGQSVILEKFETVIEFVPGQPMRTTQYRQFKALDSAGVSSLSTIRMIFDSLSEDIFVNRLEVLDERNNVVMRGSPSDFYVTDDHSSGMATYDKTLHVPVPGLMPGYTLNIVHTIRTLSAVKNIPFKRYRLGGGRPVLFSSLSVTGEVENILYRCIAAAPAAKSSHSLTWIQKEIPGYVWEPYERPWEESAPAVVLWDGGKTLQQACAKYMKDIESKLVLDKTVKTLAESIMKGTTNRQERINLMIEYVQKNLTYKPIEFGRRGQIPDAAERVIANKYGDCKDHAVLLHQLLSSAGISSVLALTSFNEDILPEAGDLDQFDHVILYIDEKAGCKFVDATEKDCDLTTIIPSGLGGRMALLLETGTNACRMVKIPEYSEKASGISSQRSVSFTSNATSLAVHETMTLEGFWAGWVRGSLKDRDAIGCNQWFSGMFGEILGNITVQSCVVSNLYNNSRPLVVQVNYENRSAIHEDADGRRLRLPVTWEATLLGSSPVASRKKDFWIKYPFTLSTVTTIKPPEGMSVSGFGSGSRGDSEIVRWTVSSTNSQGNLVIKFDGAMKNGRYSRERYAEFTEQLDMCAKRLNQPVLLVQPADAAPANKNK